MIHLLYQLYERHLRQQIRQRPVPKHIGIILDGNRRFALKQGFNDPRHVYELGAQKLDDVLAWCIELEITAVTLWVCSIDNLQRSPNEVSAIFAAVEAKIAALTQAPLIHQLGIRIQAVGRLDLLPASTAAVIREAEKATAGYDALTITIAIAYGGREEIADAVRDLIRQQITRGDQLEAIVEAITPEAIDKHLYTTVLPDPDLIIRTSGEFRLSGFLLWQSVSSEFYFCDVNWPEFRKVDFYRAVRAYQHRQRRFGQ